ncbi:MAG: hypothetical protein CO186_06505 [Zetaproteobacteria bacterium CG_4_9_14_3_um_filter_49_83]|nr:MAG: hypothetical protein AUJ56_08625 [Zetaproteobacteria bacterium CG1_02_49_23]PIQ32741.1 MAG: hypothetical protein COW62_06820 [Zetaproteobacteria bacterium CG17_big_fil_post_rev_8_21_14_2_50_50_13]PIV29606.1 MAG: hypothetical protein COS35_11090 [Zetaproteobacteria bacterium CG02_land_8_20_14_3_00_50_9]PIY54946.1 MAG: hypothetical protein COZ00_12120 [Zetaproteobacteria bacterium CG_4_10_14_0_8_um_filter_49_80]PJA35309.1 MAG: hypothetical protein CO186_06505 [Zetaproteobacteria bacterium
MWMSYQLVFSEHGYRVFYQEQQELEALQQELATLHARQEKLASQILLFRNDPKALEELVHRELGYVYPDEYMVIMPEERSEEGKVND